MLPLDKKRHLQYEFLQRRAMLTGNVLVSVVDGDLRVTGDDQNNVLGFQQLSPSDPRAVRGGVSFKISPDKATSINRNEAGVGIVVAGVTRDINVDMGDGLDDIVVRGANGGQIRNLSIDTGGGPDAVSITSFSLSGDIRVSDADSLDLSLQQTKSAEVIVKIKDIRDESKNAAAAPTSSITIRNSWLNGGAKISSDVPLSVKIHGTNVHPIDVCKVPAPPAPMPPCGTVNISSGAPLSLEMDQTRAAGLFVKIKDIQGESKDVAPASSITIRNSRLRGGADISSNAPLEVVMDQTKAKGDVLIKAEGFPFSRDFPSSQFANSIRIVDSVLGSLRIVGSEGRDELEFERLNVRGRSHIETGGGDDSLTVSDTVFGGFAFFDGGDDTNSLILMGTRFRHGSKFVNWK
jgi:hypothetical protein